MAWSGSTLAFSDEEWRYITDVSEMYGFKDMKDSTKFMFSIGFRLVMSGQILETDNGSGANRSTRYNVGTLDPDQSLLATLMLIQESSSKLETNKIFENLVSMGTKWHRAQVEEHAYVTLSDCFKLLEKK